MKLLEDRITDEGRILPGNILKVDHFLNHQVDPQLMMAMGHDFAEHFQDRQITRVLTLEVSGIAMALTAAYALKVPLVFAKKLPPSPWETMSIVLRFILTPRRENIPSASTKNSWPTETGFSSLTTFWQSARLWAV